MSKQVAMVVFNSRFSAHRHYDNGSVEKNADYVDNMETWVKRALSKGIKVEATAREAKSMLTELLGTIPLPDEEETRIVKRYHIRLKGGVSRAFVSPEKAEDHYNKYCARLNYPWGMEIITNEVEVKV